MQVHDDNGDKITATPWEYLWVISSAFVLGNWSYYIRWLHGLAIVVLLISSVVTVLQWISHRRKR